MVTVGTAVLAKALENFGATCRDPQTVVYFLEVVGIPLGYSFQVSTVGPVSVDLVETLSYMRDDPKDLHEVSSNMRFVDGVYQKMDRVKELFEVPSEIKHAEHYWFMILSSLHFFAQACYGTSGPPQPLRLLMPMEQRRVEREILEKLPIPPNFRRIFPEAWRRIEAISFISNQHETTR